MIPNFLVLPCGSDGSAGATNLMLEDLSRNAPKINPDARYWFVRSEGGELYPAFIATNSIAIRYEEISLGFIKSLDQAEEEKSREKLKVEIKKFYPPTKGEDGKLSDRSGLAASQLLRFCVEMKPGDVVVIPSKNTDHLAIGTIEDKGPFEEALVIEGVKWPHNKRRKVRWIRRVDRAAINPNLFRLFLNPQTVIDATPYAEWIDALLYQFFKKGEEFHYVMRVGAKEHIRAQSLFRSCIELFDLADEFAKTEGINLDFENVETRINLNSPGDVELWKTGAQAIGLIAILVVFINGGGFEMNVAGKFKLSLKTEGLLKRLSDFLTERKRTEVVESIRKKLDRLKVETPEQVVDLLKGTKK